MSEVLDQLHERVQTAYVAATNEDEKKAKDNPTERTETVENISKMRPMGLNCDALIQNTIQKNNSRLYNGSSSASSEQTKFRNAGFTDENGYGKKSLVIGLPKDSGLCAEPQITSDALLSLCPNFAEHVWAPDRPNWHQILLTVEHIIRPHLKIPLSTWISARRHLGRERAAIAIAIIFEKYEAGLIRSPGAYLSGMVSKAKSGGFHLSSSLFHRRLQTNTPAGLYSDRGKSVARS